jgi:hypothetical protein
MQKKKKRREADKYGEARMALLVHDPSSSRSSPADRT